MAQKKDFLTIAELSPAELSDILELALRLKREWKSGGNPPMLKNKAMAMVFTKPSLRTRMSFEMAMFDLGGKAMYIGPDEVQLGKRESVPDVARVLSRYVDLIMARVFEHQDVVTLAQYASVPVINGLSDHEHPCQALADLLTILERKGSLKGLQLTYLGDANNVANSLVYGAVMLGAHVTVAAPRGYGLWDEVAVHAQRFAVASGGSVTQVEDARAGVESADVLYTDAWYSMGQESEAAKRAAIFPPYQMNRALMDLAQPDAIAMHCLPAHRGQEITDDVADSPQSVLWDQAENRLHAQKAVLVKLLVH
ncbi:MAG: ornithine carbamoyltransferase [Chloroflexi bacterium]|nr:ornithine carbamoyltransferase [Chloroflexota bacterium]